VVLSPRLWYTRMSEKYEKKTLYEYCETRKLMVRLEVIQSTVRMPDLVHAEVKLMPVDCNRADECKREGISCLVYDHEGLDPCPEVWKGLL
jgi:hypothetical protein